MLFTIPQLLYNQASSNMGFKWKQFISFRVHLAAGGSLKQP
jgi:hypothetical protein